MKNLIFVLLLLVSCNSITAQLPPKNVGRLIEVNDANIYVEEYGQGEPLFLLHGFLSTADNWKNFVEAYSQNYRVIIWDMRGHGRSSDPNSDNDFKHHQAARDLLTLMEVLKIDKAKAIGHSSGGITILYAATMAPEKFDAIIPVSAQSFYSEPVRDWIKSRIWEKYFNHEELDKLHGPEKAKILKRQFFGFGTLAGDPWIPKEELVKIKARTLIVHGDDDFIPVSHAWDIYQNIPGARIWISPNTGHMPHYGKENGLDFIRRTLDFLKGEKW